MKKQFLSLAAVGLAILLSAFTFKKANDKKQEALNFLKTHYQAKTNFASWTVFEYNWGPDDDPNSYTKVPYFVYISDYCPGTGQLCAIYAEEDLFNNPGHPTQDCLYYLLDNFGFYYYFPFEVPGLIELKWGF